VLAALLILIPIASAHIGIFHESMFCRDGPQENVDWNTNTVVNPLFALNFADFWFGNGVYNGVSAHCYNWPPPAGQFLELPAGGSFNVQFANNRAFSGMGLYGGQVSTFPDGEPHPEYDEPGYNNPACVPSPLLHTMNHSDVAGSAFAISYHSEYSQVTPENMAVFSVAYGTPWHTAASFQVPADMPACPSGGCLCGWGWVPNNCGQPNIYLQLFRCNVTGAKPNAPAIAPAKPPVWCENDQTSCTKGAKQLVIWHQAERNNINTDTGTGVAGEEDDGQQKSPGYNTKIGFKDGPQNDIFVTSGSTSTSTHKSTSTRMSIQRATSTHHTTGAPATTNTALPAGWSLKHGCVKDMPPPNRLMTFEVDQKAMTPTSCVSYCESHGYTYAGLQYGKQCFCSKTLETSGGAGGSATGCSMKCPGDSTKRCGGIYRMEVFEKK
jgi:hypothetical protein